MHHNPPASRSGPQMRLASMASTIPLALRSATFGTSRPVVETSITLCMRRRLVLLFGVGLVIAVVRGPTAIAEFLAAVLVDFVVSLDDVLVFPLIGASFGLAAEAQRR